MKRAMLTAVILGFGLAFGGSSMADEFECPVSSDLAKTPLSAEIIESIPKGEALKQPGQLQSAIILLREHGMDSDDIINRLIELYCPYAASDPNSSIEQKTAEVQKFAAAASAAVLNDSDENAVIFNIPLTPSVAELATQRARAAGISTEKWIADTVGRAVE